MPNVLRTDDAGATWHSLTDGLPPAPANGVLFDPADPEHLYLATDGGAFFSTDGGSSWLALGPGLPAAPILDLAFAWLLAHEPVASVIAGATKPAQVRANVEAAGWTLTEDDLAEVDALLAQPA